MPRHTPHARNTGSGVHLATARSPKLHRRRFLASALMIGGAVAPHALGGTAPVPQSPGTDATLAPLPAITPVDQAAPAPAPGVPAPGGAVPTVAPVEAPVTSLPLTVGMKGQLVKDMQRELRRRGARIAVDGSFGDSTAAAVRKMQRRFKLAVTGQPDAKFLRRLGLQNLSVAGVSLATPVQVSDVLPSWVHMEAWPTTGDITSPFGWRWGRMHEGIDISSNASPPVTAALPGTVTYAGWEDGYGNLVTLSHGNGLETRYGHLASITVAKGDPVATGTQLGIMGSTGRSTGIHLHFEVRVGGTPYNPLAALPARS